MNFEVARLFEEIARSLDVKGEQGHRPRAYRRAARGVAAHPESVELLAEEGRLREIPGIGPSLEALIAEYLTTGAMGTHARLVEAHPPGLAPLLAARGFGPAGVESLHQALGVASLDDIEAAAVSGRLAEAIGPKRAADLLAQLPQLRNPIRRLRLKPAWEAAHNLLALLGKPRELAVAGAARRMSDMVEGGLDLLSASRRTLEDFCRLPVIERVIEQTATSARARLFDGLEVRLHVAEPANWGAALVWHTGSVAHVARLQTIAEQRGLRFSSAAMSVATPAEEDVYAALGLPWIAPELREDQGEIAAALSGSLPNLVA